MDNFKPLTKVVEQNSAIVLGLLVALVLLVVYLMLRPAKQSFSPTALARMQENDTPNVGSRVLVENAEGGPAVAAAPAQAGPKEGSPAWNVLHSDEFACDKRAAVGDDAWSWMVAASHSPVESAAGGRALNSRASEDLLSKKLGGR